MIESFYPQWCLQCGNPSPLKWTVVSQATSVKNGMHGGEVLELQATFELYSNLIVSLVIANTRTIASKYNYSYEFIVQWLNN